MAETCLGRMGAFVVFRDEDGLRHAVKLGAVLAVSDADDTGSMTAITMSANRVAVVREGFEQVLAWFG